MYTNDRCRCMCIHTRVIAVCAELDVLLREQTTPRCAAALCSSKCLRCRDLSFLRNNVQSPCVTHTTRGGGVPVSLWFHPCGTRRLRHVLVRGCVSPQLLHERFPQIKGAYTQQALDYGKNSRYGDRWKISCYIVVLEKWKPKIMPHEPTVSAGVGVGLCESQTNPYASTRICSRISRAASNGM